MSVGLLCLRRFIAQGAPPGAVRGHRSAGVSPAAAGRPRPAALRPTADNANDKRSGAGRPIAAGETPALPLRAAVEVAADLRDQRLDVERFLHRRIRAELPELR